MGLDVYVGSLTRYYARDWETIVQQAARRQGIQVQVMRPNPLPDEQIKNPAQIRDLVIEWRSKMQAELKGAELIDADLDWPEQPETPYFTDKPDWECFGAMTLLAAYEEEPKPIFGSRWPKTLKDSWARDPKLEARLKAPAPGRYSHLYGCMAWIPARIKNPVTGPMPTGDPVMIGSAPVLLEQLELLNQQTYAGGPEDLVRWSREMPDPSETRFELKAKTGLGIFLNLTRLAVEHHLPMLLDY